MSRTLCTFILLALLSACGSPVNQQNFDRIETGMREMEVLNILGNPTRSDSVSVGPLSGTSATWESGKATITIQFINGEVAFKSFTRS